MTVNTSYEPRISACDGSTTSFTVPFQYQLPGDLIVELIDDDSGAVTLLVEGTDYSRVGNGMAAPSGIATLSAYPAGNSIRRRRETVRDQLLQTVPNVLPGSARMEAAWDRQALVAQEQDFLQADLNVRAPLVPPGEVAPPFDSLAGRDGELILISGGALRALDRTDYTGKFVSFGPLGPLPSSGTGNDPALRADLAQPDGPSRIGWRDGDALAALDATQIPDTATLATADPAITPRGAVPGIGTFDWDANVPPGETGATNARTPGYLNPGRKRRYAGIGTGTGRFVDDRGRLRARHWGITPWNSAGANDAAWAALTADMTDLQTRQENRPLRILFDEDRYLFSSRLDIKQCFVGIEGNGAEFMDVCLRITNAGSVNQILHNSLRGLTAHAPAGAAYPLLETLVASYLTVEDCHFYGISTRPNLKHGPGNTNSFSRCRFWGGSYGTMLTAAVFATPSGTDKGQPIDVSFHDCDWQGNGYGVAIYEGQSVRIFGGAIQNNTGAGGRGLTAETCLGLTVIGTHFERNGADIYLQPVDRLGTAQWGTPLPHGGINIYGALIGGEGIGGAPSPYSLLVAGDTPNLTVCGGIYRGSVNINTAGTTGTIIGAEMNIYSQHASSPLVRQGGRQPAIADLAVAPTAGDFNNLLAKLRAFGVGL